MITLVNDNHVDNYLKEILTFVYYGSLVSCGLKSEETQVMPLSQSTTHLRLQKKERRAKKKKKKKRKKKKKKRKRWQNRRFICHDRHTKKDELQQRNRLGTIRGKSTGDRGGGGGRGRGLY